MATRRTYGWSSLSKSSLSEDPECDKVQAADIEYKGGPALRPEGMPMLPLRAVHVHLGEQSLDALQSSRSIESTGPFDVVTSAANYSSIGAPSAEQHNPSSSGSANNATQGSVRVARPVKRSLDVRQMDGPNSLTQRERPTMQHDLPIALDPLATPVLAVTSSGKSDSSRRQQYRTPPSPRLSTRSSKSLKSPLIGSIRSKAARMRKKQAEEPSAPPTVRVNELKPDKSVDNQSAGLKKRAHLLNELLVQQVQGN